MAENWNQKPFDEALRKYLGRLKNDKVPKALNKKAFFVALRAFNATPKKEGPEIEAELAKPVTATRKDGSTGVVDILWALVAKRVGKRWPEQKMGLGIRNKTGRANIGRAYRSALRRAAKQTVGARKRAGGFIRIGWLSVIKKLGPLVRARAGAPSADMNSVRLRGALKGDAKPATPGIRPVCTIVNTAQARSEKRGGFFRIGSAALQRAFNEETADTNAYLEKEFQPETEACNRELK